MEKVHCSWHFVPCFHLSCCPVEDIRQIPGLTFYVKEKRWHKAYIFHLKLYDNNNSAIVLLKRFSLCFRIAEDATTLKLEDALNADETSREDEDKLPQEARGLKDLWEGDEGKESWDEDEAENEDEHEQEQEGVDDDNDDNENEDEDSNEDEHEQEGDDEDDDEDEDANEDAGEHAHEGDEDRAEMKRTSTLFLQG